MARKPKSRSHRAYKEWAPSVKIIRTKYYQNTHGKINGRATVNLIINILDSHTNHSSRLKKVKMTKKKKEKNITIYDKRNAFSLQQKEKRYLLHFEFQN